MTPTTRHRLLEDTLHPDALAESLAATRRSARHRRLTRRVARAGAAGMMLGVAWLALVRPRPSDVVGSSTHLPIRSAAPTRPHHLVVTTDPAAGPVKVRTEPASAGAAAAPRVHPGTPIVSTRSFPSVVPRATEDDLFAAAGTRPAALHRLPNGSARWVWLDGGTPW